jgi:hypothetical protein
VSARSAVTGPIALGLALLYASAYFLPLLDAAQLYFVPSLWHDVAMPSLVTVAVLTPVIFGVPRLVRSSTTAPVPPLLLWVGATVLALITVRSAFAAAGYSAVGILLVIVGQESAGTDVIRYWKLLLLCGTLGAVGWVVWIARARWLKMVVFIAILGYAFTLLAFLRIATLPARTPLAASRSRSSPPTAAPRRVVWVIFDELDFEQTFGDATISGNDSLPNLFQLRDRAVSAEHAWSPAKDTEESLPALLTGQPIQGSRFDKRGGFELATAAAEVPFTERNSVFARLPGGPGSAALIGYFHPYCKIFPALGACDSFYLGNVGRWFDGLLFFSEATFSLVRWVPGATNTIPSALQSTFNPMYRITEEILGILPARLAERDKALLFVHLNVPHYPAEFAQTNLHLPPTANDRAAYRQNLLLVDRLIGQIVTQLASQPTGGETLLLLSSDHWHRIDSPTTARNIPFIAWHVGEQDRFSIDEPISTVNTEALILDFLAGRVTTHAELAGWWRDKPVYPSWIPANFKN